MLPLLSMATYQMNDKYPALRLMYMLKF